MIKDLGSASNMIRPAMNPVGDVFRGRASNTSGVQSFKEQLSKVQDSSRASVAGLSPAQVLKFSNHALDRMQSRGIRFSPEDMGRIENAVNKAAAKGSKEALLLTDAAALIVSVKDKTVVTVMDKMSLKDNVFTNIDSAVMI